MIRAIKKLNIKNYILLLDGKDKLIKLNPKIKQFPMLHFVLFIHSQHLIQSGKFFLQRYNVHAIIKFKNIKEDGKYKFSLYFALFEYLY